MSLRFLSVWLLQTYPCQRYETYLMTLLIHILKFIHFITM